MRCWPTQDLAQFEADLWQAADNLRANSKLTRTDYFMPVLGIIFLRHAANRFEAATKQIEEDQKKNKMRSRKVKADELDARNIGQLIKGSCKVYEFESAKTLDHSTFCGK